MPSDQPTISVEQFARALVKEFGLTAKSMAESGGSCRSGWAATELIAGARAFDIAKAAVASLAAAHGVNIEEGGE